MLILFPRIWTSRRFSCLLVLILALVLTGCRTLEPTDPEPISAASSSTRTESSIRDAVRREAWVIETSTAGEFTLQDEAANSSLRAQVIFDDEQVTIRWIDHAESLGDTPAEVTAARKVIRRRFRSLMLRIEYLIESADLSAD